MLGVATLSAQGLLPPRQRALIRSAAQSPERVAYVAASRTEGTVVMRWWNIGWATNVARFSYVDLTNQPIAAPKANVQISWPMTVVIRTIDDLTQTNWEQVQFTASGNVIVPNDRPQRFFQIPIPNQTARVSWDSSPSPQVVSYRLLIGTNTTVYTSTLDAGTNTTYLVSDLSPASRFFFAVKSVDNEGNESDPSNEVVYDVPSPEIDIVVE